MYFFQLLIDDRSRLEAALSPEALIRSEEGEEEQVENLEEANSTIRSEDRNVPQVIRVAHRKSCLQITLYDTVLIHSIYRKYGTDSCTGPRCR